MATTQSIIKTLPGFDGDLPFKLETGYVGVGKSDEVQLFYYFVESEREPEEDPLVLSLTGGPGCSAIYALTFEIGPITYDSSTFGSSLPSLILNPYSWTKISNVIFLDQPVGAGFSYANSSEGYLSSDTETTNHIYTFLVKWLENHPKFKKNSLYIQGESYAGKMVPLVAWEIVKALTDDNFTTANEAGLQPQLSLQGYLAANPATDQLYANDRVPYAHNMGLISDEYMKLAEQSCKGNYVNQDTDNVQCKQALESINETTYYKISESWANNPRVREALRIREGSKGEWVRCNRSLTAYKKDVESVVDLHRLLSKKGYKGLVYSGDHDMVVPYFNSLNWIRSFNLTLDDNWRPWKVNGQIAGYTTRYQENGTYLTFATLKGAGHTPPEYKPEECFNMISRWLSDGPL
ncbi:serine carboxypeptidase-like 18 [Phtheirospermum japonicum]|uniref:Carboxypeptidase n=1 Tax=Phtheirospermum japonicum TaxID=374723 RepID=A0A830CLK5_9LAMI|nr:serine carboxypeptidase-like 18 [Phtheirospermum japonicum]